MKNKLLIIGSLVLATVLFAWIGPYGDVIDALKSRQFTGMLFAVTFFELCFLGGLLVMAYAVGHDLGSNVLKWKKQLRAVIKKVVKDRTFWFGFWLNFVGAIGTTSVLIIASVFYLPIYAKWVVVFGIIDLMITLSLRKEILSLKA